MKQKRLRHALLTGQEKAEKGGEVKSKSRGRPTKIDKMSPLDLKNLQRYKLWSVIMKKVNNAPGKFRQKKVLHFFVGQGAGLIK